MLCTLLYLFASGITFIEQDFATIPIQVHTTFTGQNVPNFRHADLDANGKSDLVFETGVVFQTETGFAVDAFAPLPSVPGPARLDLWNNELYVLDPQGQLSIFRRDAAGWVSTHTQALEDARASASQPEHAAYRFAPMLHDLDQDGRPEIILIDTQGVLLFHWKGQGYGNPARLNIFPRPSLAQPRAIALWPPEARHIAIPPRQMTCRLRFHNNTLVLLERQNAPADHAEYHSTAYTLEKSPDWGVRLPPATFQTQPLPAHLRPYPLNQDGTLDFAGLRWAETRRSPIPITLCETWATLDGGHSFFIQRTPALPGFRPRTAFVDFEGDGDLDMITERTGVLDGGAKEVVARFMTRRAIDLHYPHPLPSPRKFSEKPSCEARFTLELEAPPAAGDALFSRYEDGEVFNLTGDFNGDGYRDLLVRSQKNSAAVYLASGFSYAARPDATIAIPAQSSISIADVNADGQDDVLAAWSESKHDSALDGMADAQSHTWHRVFQAQETAP